MKLTIGNLRRFIQREWMQQFNRDSLSPDRNDREAIEQQTLKTLDGEDDELSPHLRGCEEPDENDQGPVGRRHFADDFEFAPRLDPYAQDWHAAPRIR